MKVAYVVERDGEREVVVGEGAKLVPGDAEVLVKVHAAGVTPSELSWYPTTHCKDGSPRVKAVPGHEFSGTIVEVGRDAGGFSVDDAVYGMNDWFRDGATAEYCVTSPAMLARKPQRLTHAEAATVPIGALTAWQALFERARLQAGERILVHGGAGAVGAFVIQLAKMHGAEVIATATGVNLEFIESLKADEVVDYRSVRFEDVIAKVDVVFDAVGGDTLERSWRLLNPGGRAVTIAADSEGTSDRRVKDAFFIVETNQEQLENVGLLIDGGTLRPFVGAVVPLSSAPAAYAGTVARRDGRGKVVVGME